MKKLTWLILLFSLFYGLTSEAKNYTRKAVRPAASDNTWSDYDYNFNLDDNGNLTGTNTFTKVYNSAPTKGINSSWRKMYTGYETLVISVLPGNRNYKYTMINNVTEWEWDSHLLKWVKSRVMPTNGTRSFTIKNGKLNGPFEIPVVASYFGINFICGNASDGIIPDGSTFRWKDYDYTKSAPRYPMEIKSDGDSTLINVVTYLEDVMHRNLDGPSGLGKFGESESGYYIVLDFPFIRNLGGDIPLLTHVESLSGIGLYKLERYTHIPLPDVYCNSYINPYDPVTKTLPNGHTLISTRQRDGSIHTKEIWEENGYSYYQKYDGAYHPAIGNRQVGDTLFLHYKNLNGKNSSDEEQGYILNKKYYLKTLKDNGRNYTVDYSHAQSDGYIVIADGYTQRYAYCDNKENRPALTTYKLNSNADKTEYAVFKEIDSNGVIRLPASLTEEMQGEALAFINFINHPYIKRLYPTKFSLKEISMNSSGIVTGWEGDWGKRTIPYNEKKQFLDYYRKMLGLTRSPDNPLKKLQSSIGMELDIPDYDYRVTKKIDNKIVGKRTAKLLNELPKYLNKKLGTGKDTWPNGIKKSFLKGKTTDDIKDARISRIVKNGNEIDVYVTSTLLLSDTENETVLKLKDNLPIDEYIDVWRILVTK
ncbi:MAG: hypothetical protein K2M31_02610 [Muribaculaceae bacterium]|nr:hypothetical protein [Muribaculaceae bacterium]